MEGGEVGNFVAEFEWSLLGKGGSRSRSKPKSLIRSVLCLNGIYILYISIGFLFLCIFYSFGVLGCHFYIELVDDLIVVIGLLSLWTDLCLV